MRAETPAFLKIAQTMLVIESELDNTNRNGKDRPILFVQSYMLYISFDYYSFCDYGFDYFVKTYDSYYPVGPAPELFEMAFYCVRKHLLRLQ